MRWDGGEGTEETERGQWWRGGGADMNPRTYFPVQKKKGKKKRRRIIANLLIKLPKCLWRRHQRPPAASYVRHCMVY